LCVWGIYFASVTTIFLLDFGTVPKVCYFFVFHFITRCFVTGNFYEHFRTFRNHFHIPSSKLFNDSCIRKKLTLTKCDYQLMATIQFKKCKFSIESMLERIRNTCLNQRCCLYRYNHNMPIILDETE